MQIFNSPTRYGAVAQSLHWFAVALVILAWVLGVSDDLLPKGPARATGLQIHIAAGLLVIVLTIVRLLYRTADPSPPVEKTEFGDGSFAGWMGLGAKLAHVGLYVLLVAVPLVGIAVQFARGDALPVFGLFDIASPWPADRAFARSLKGIHELLAHGLLALAGLHAAAALLHHWVFGDRTLTRMLPGSDADR
ncbi:cytochrome b [Bradyrhizobium sp.]|uniref:cytochrome b n=1 Tax=Bradyrhizobium sp. TaxID=376 RepID=UPI00273615C2|nr:cytochrome b/b6 domain-containing protein [Bradyrhizobium sp.]MDP3078346.1 cytochrome b/b6 domain-containing protein [Bradyrhizobium sp.]